MSKFYTRSVNQYRINALDFSVDAVTGIPSAAVVASCMHDGINEPRERKARAILTEQTGIAILPSMAIVCTPAESATYRIDSRLFQKLASTEKPSGEYVSRTIKSYSTPIYEVVWDDDTHEPETRYLDTLYTTGDEPTAKDVKNWCNSNDHEYTNVTWHAFADSDDAVTYYLPVDLFVLYGERVANSEELND